MKKFLILACSIGALLACNREDAAGPVSKTDFPTVNEATTATLNVSLDLEDDTQTRASSYVTAQPYEAAVNSVQVLVFDSSGALNAYVDADTRTSDISISTTAGAKTVWAVVNGPDLSSVSTLSALQSRTIDLSDNSTTASAGFVMTGQTSCSVGSTVASANVAVRRMVARVALVKVNNALPSSYGAMTVNNVTLINVVGNQNLAGTASISTWYNKMGRKDGATASSQIIDGSTNPASCPTLTFKSVGSSVANGSSLSPTTPYLFYTYPNSTTTDVTGWSSTFTARKTKLVVVVTIAGSRYYYPVVIDTPARNTAYTVNLTITGLGATDPDRPVEKGSINASVSVQAWTGGAVYDEII